MKDLSLTIEYDIFEEKIKEFRENPKDYRYKIKSLHMRSFQNAIGTFLFWMIFSILINLLLYIYFLNSADKIDSSSLISIFFLFLTVLVRSTTLNHFLYKKIGQMGKLYKTHQGINRIGFLHRFMATSTLIWLFVYIYYLEFKAPYWDELILCILSIMLVLMIFTASSLFRRKNHNIFENIHRYFGYLSFMLLTSYFFLSLLDQFALEDILIKPHIIILFLIVAFLISPWIAVKRVQPKLIHSAPHVIAMKIEGKPSYGTYSSITLANGNFHPFGDSMFDFDDMENRTLYITPAGDRTSQIVSKANEGEFLLEKCTLKNDRKCGFMYHHSVYDRIVIVVTGGGIAPIIPCLVLNKYTQIIVLWFCHSPKEEFGEDVLTRLSNKISKHDINIHILDTDDEDLQGFTNETYTSLALEACSFYNPEAVFVMSNQKFTIDLMHSLRENNLKAYGANFDS